MDASIIFSDVLKYIEDSGLNYLMKKSPFSANISIKSTLIRRYSDKSPNAEYVANKVQTDVKKENVQEDISLKELVSLRESYNSVANEKEILEDILGKERGKLKDLENQIAEQRSELLRVKSERKKSKQKIKTLEDENIKLKDENQVIKKQVEERSDSLKTAEIKIADLEAKV